MKELFQHLRRINFSSKEHYKEVIGKIFLSVFLQRRTRIAFRHIPILARLSCSAISKVNLD